MSILSGFLRRLSGENPDTSSSEDLDDSSMAAEDKDVIVRFAGGENELRSQAIEIHRRYIPVLGVRGTAEMRFMAEIDNPAPDAYLRSEFRADVLKTNDVKPGVGMPRG